MMRPRKLLRRRFARRFLRPKTETQKALWKLAQHRKMIKRPYIEEYLGYIKFEPAADIVMNSGWLRYKSLRRYLNRRGKPIIRKCVFTSSIL